MGAWGTAPLISGRSIATGFRVEITHQDDERLLGGWGAAAWAGRLAGGGVRRLGVAGRASENNRTIKCFSGQRRRPRGRAVGEGRRAVAQRKPHVPQMLQSAAVNLRHEDHERAPKRSSTSSAELVFAVFL